jgi:protein subunit release factor B
MTLQCPNIIRKANERSVMDVARGELVEKELDQMIERRSRQKDPDEESESWRQSVRAYEEKRRQMARLEWHAFHCGQAERHRATLKALIEHHQEQAAKLMEVEPKGAA